jgi:hypothetical protein
VVRKLLSPGIDADVTARNNIGVLLGILLVLILLRWQATLRCTSPPIAGTWT